jgi:putative membrane protein
LNKLSLVLKGLAMGIAEVIPGVSGGTIAFITGIYETLIKSIKSFGPEAIDGLKQKGVSGLWTAINGNFLLFLMIGMGLGFVSGVFVISDLLITQPEILWGFFFGLIIASCVLIGLEIDQWNWKKALLLILGAVFAYGVTTLAPAEGSLNLMYVYLSAVIAISALMLPGISGSFLLLIMGMYTLIIPTFKRILTDFNTNDLVIVIVFGLGALTGLVVFSRVLSWLFSKYKASSFAVLTGFMVGSLNKVWPWRNTTDILLKDTGTIQSVNSLNGFETLDKESYKILSEVNVLPDGYLYSDPKTVEVIVAILFGMSIVYLLHKINIKKFQG